MAVEVLRRLKGMDLEANPGVKAAVTRAVEGMRGSPEYVDLVRDFRLTGQESGLVESAVRFSGQPAGAEAIRLLLQGGHDDRIRLALREGVEADRSALATSLAQAAEPRALPLLAAMVVDGGLRVTDRATAVRGMAQLETGARDLLRLAEEGRLDEATKTTASLALAQSRWPELREAAARVLPLPVAGDGQRLPTMAELVERRGDAGRGAAVFRSEAAGCLKCHRVGTEGVDFGPELTGIGGKLGRQGLYESILDPSAGIAFGYEAWTVETRGGDEHFGRILSETPEEVVLRLPGGGTVTVGTGGILRRERQPLSSMPAGLAQLLSVEALVDLVEYLTTLEGTGGADRAGR